MNSNSFRIRLNVLFLKHTMNVKKLDQYNCTNLLGTFLIKIQFFEQSSVSRQKGCVIFSRRLLSQLSRV